VDIASDSVLPVTQWTWYVRVVLGSGQTGRTGGKCRFVRKFISCMVHKMILSFPNEENGMGRTCVTYVVKKSCMQVLSEET
jgi:hypothetical protein